MVSVKEFFRIAQLRYDSAEPPEDWRDEALIWAETKTRAELLQMLEHLIEAGAPQKELQFWKILLYSRPRPTDLTLYTDENTVVIGNSATGTDWAIWPRWLEAVCPGYNREVALRVAAQALHDTRCWLDEEYIP